MREFHVWFFSPWYRTYNSYCDVLEDVKEGYDGINTQNLVFCDMKIITKYGYRLFIHPQIGEAFEIKPETNLLHLLLSGEFDTEDCKVVEEVF